MHGKQRGFTVDNAMTGCAPDHAVEVNIDPLELKVGVAMIGACGVNSVLVSDNFPEFGTDLILSI